MMDQEDVAAHRFDQRQIGAVAVAAFNKNKLCFGKRPAIGNDIRKPDSDPMVVQPAPTSDTVEI